MSINTFMSFFDKAEGESIQRGKEKWIEIQDWDWEVEAESSWTIGSGASVGKPNPGKLNFQQRFNTASIVLLGYICSGKAFPKCELQILKESGKGNPRPYFTMVLEEVYITKVSNAGTEEGNVLQRVEMVFKTIRIEYKLQDNTGRLGDARTYNWDIPAGTASPSA